MNQSGFIYGGDYNPEQWLAMPEILEQDIEYMKAVSYTHLRAHET